MRLLKFILNFFKRIFLKREEEEPRNHFVIQLEKKVHNPPVEPNEPEEEEEEVRLMKLIAGAHGKEVPSSGTTSVADLDGDLKSLTSGFLNCSANLVLSTTGDFYWDNLFPNSPDTQDIGSWFSPEGTPDVDRYVRLTKTSGDTLVSSDVGTWRLVNSSQEVLWLFINSTQGTTKTGVYKLEMATDASGTNIISTADFTAALSFNF